MTTMIVNYTLYYEEILAKPVKVIDRRRKR
jgi:hypothetical protein